jgi:putative acetyltransferase
VPLRIVLYEDRFAADFKRLNMEWLEGFALFEDADLKHLDHPRTAIVDRGGEIFVAIENDEVLGTCGVVPSHAPNTVELIKLAVSSRAQGRGIGRQLAMAVIEHARKMGATRIELVSSSKLKAALKLYESLGFVYGPLPAEPGYATTDIYMVLELN